MKIGRQKSSADITAILPEGDDRFTPYGPGITHRPAAVHSTEIKASIMKTITKDQFVALLNEAGITDEQKHRLQVRFEIRHPLAYARRRAMAGAPG